LAVSSPAVDDRHRHLTVSPIAGSLGAEVSGVDLAVDLDGPDGDAVLGELHRAWLDHLVLFFRDHAHLDSGRFLAFARRIGNPVEYPFVKGHDDHPEIISVVKLPHETVNFGGIWHADTTYLDRPPMATVLIAREIPPAGGDTLFASQYAAYEALSPAMRELLDPLRAISSSALADVSKTREDRVRDSGFDGTGGVVVIDQAADQAADQGPNDITDETGDTDERVFEASHPVVRTHPETGRKALYVNVAHTARFDGMTVEESRPLLDFLFHHQVRPEFTCRFVWRVGSIALWDNRCVLHNPVNDYHGHKREMHRITLEGDVPR
jgi:taurine dioxygenase